MPHDLSAPRVVIASGMAKTGVSTVAALIQHAAPALNVVDGGLRWADILEACTPGFVRMIVVTTHDIVSVSSAYALIKLVRDRFPDAPVEVLVNRSEARDALKTYERIQAAASHFLGEMVGYAGSVPEAAQELDGRNAGRDAGGDADSDLGAGAHFHEAAVVDVVADTSAPVSSIIGGGQAIMALQDLATRLDGELIPTTAGRGALRRGER
ncbi:MAG: MinD/ParA family ATP-binding protein, partial [Gemmatimonadaceae bacterium]